MQRKEGTTVFRCKWSPCDATFPLRIGLRRHQRKCLHRPPLFHPPSATYTPTAARERQTRLLSTTPTPTATEDDDDVGVIFETPPPTPPIPTVTQDWRQQPRTPTAIRKTTKPLKFLCKFCGKGFGYRHHCEGHENENCPANPDRELPSNTCPTCRLVIRGNKAMLKFHILLNHTIIDINTLSQSQMKLLHPFHTNQLNQLRTVDPVLPHHANFRELCMKWVKRLDVYCTAEVARVTGPCSVYLVATIGGRFTSAADAFDYVMKGGENVSFYIGCNGNGICVGPHHFTDPNTSCLGQAGQRGQTVVLLKLWEFKGTVHKDNLQSAHELESKLIAYALSGQKYIAKDGSRMRWLNMRREASTFLTLPIADQEKAITDGVTGVPFLCRAAKCGPDCVAFLHLNKKDCKILPFPIPTQSNFQRPPQLLPPKKLLSDPHKIEKEVADRIKQLRTRQDYEASRKACVYIALMPLTEQYGQLSPTEYCRHLNETPQVDETIQGYIGKNRQPSGVSDVHTRTPHLTNPGKAIFDGSRKCIQVGVIPRVNVDEAEKLEALLLVHLFLQARVRRQGRKVDPFNKQISPAAWLRCSKEEKQEVVELGLAGVSPITFGTEKPRMKMKGVKYPIVINMADVKEMVLPTQEEDETN
ncbi:hypothetical protein Fcan01_02605 [Folsomia candida]|uniref:C2H2-type domain-containing protein n=2 Tax=Folsomia candida TaxID=158441 RepID=A0A226EW29_FOLCA|nr:hypothetical protein Fcan01_02605 [Folsomia candida]